MSRNYKVNPKHLVTIHRPEYPEPVPEDVSIYLDAKPQIKKPWSPINEKHYQDDSSDDKAEDDDNNQDDQELVFPITPLLSNEIAFQAQMIKEHDEALKFVIIYYALLIILFETSCLIDLLPMPSL